MSARKSETIPTNDKEISKIIKEISDYTINKLYGPRIPKGNEETIICALNEAFIEGFKRGARNNGTNT